MTTKTLTIEIPGTPPSFNAVGLHTHWTVGRKAKADWQQRCEIMLMKHKVPRGLDLVTATAMIAHKTRRRRDEGNFRVILEKALGDALTAGGWLPDDTPDHYRFGAVDLVSPAPEALTTLTLAYSV